MDITPTSVFDISAGANLNKMFMKVQNENQRFLHLLKAARALSTITHLEGGKMRLSGFGSRCATFAAVIVNFVAGRGIMKVEDMPATPFIDILKELEKNSMERGLEKFPFSSITKIEQLAKFTMEEFEEIFASIWAMYPYRDEGYVRHLGFLPEASSFCQWSMEWNINSSAVTCEITRCQENLPF